jgi:outer membrane protein assembly factor BamE (lipoprotein component of BamABCDE complex)
LSCNDAHDASRTRIRRGLAGGILIALFLFSGCAFFRGNYDDAFDEKDVAAIKVGTSTRQDVADLLGAPERVIEVNDQEIFHYYTYAVKSGTLLFFSRTNVVGNDLYVFFSRDGIARQVVFGRQKPPPKMQFWPFGD